jgi:hypothetical protein
VGHQAAEQEEILARADERMRHGRTPEGRKAGRDLVVFRITWPGLAEPSGELCWNPASTLVSANTLFLATAGWVNESMAIGFNILGIVGYE